MATYHVCSMRTLENKISDGGPSDMRVDPHVLTRVRNEMLDAGIYKRKMGNGAPWYYHREADEAAVQGRLAELLPLHDQFRACGYRIGQALEIAIWRALRDQNRLPFLGNFPDLDTHDDSTLYSKEEPPRSISGVSMPGKRSLDFLILSPDGGPLGLEIKNLREWLYPDREEIQQMLLKCTAVDAVPVLVARRIHFSTFAVLQRCGVIMHETFNQRVPLADAALMEKVRHKTLLGFHDIRLGNEYDERLRRFFHTNLPAVAAEARARFEEFKDLLELYGSGEMSYSEFAARSRRRSQGADEDSDFDPDEYLDYSEDLPDEEV